MKIWTGKICRSLPWVESRALRRGFLCTALGSVFLFATACSSSAQRQGAPAGDVPSEVSLKTDRQAIEQLRKEVPEEVKKSNDRLGDTLQRWRAQKMEPDRLREKFNDEIRKLRNAMDDKQRKAREEFQRNLADKRIKFLDKLKSDRESFYASKPTSEQRNNFSSRQQSDRDRYFGDERDAREEFDDSIKDERKMFEDDIQQRWVEFRQEMPVYERNWREMKAAEEKQHEENLANPKHYNGNWPYKFPGDENTSANGSGNGSESNGGNGNGGLGSNAGNGVNSGAPAKPENADVNKGGSGWPSSDPSEFDSVPKSSGH